MKIQIVTQSLLNWTVNKWFKPLNFKDTKKLSKVLKFTKLEYQQKD